MPPEVPQYFVIATILTAFLFLSVVWFMCHRAIYSLNFTKNKKPLYSFLILASLIIWFALVLFLSKPGFYVINPLVAPNIMLGFLFLFIVLQKVYASEKVKIIADAIPIPWIVGIQFYRIVGYGFIILWQMNLLPAAFAFSAGIGDMIVGFAAPFVAALYFFKKSYSKNLVKFWNILGIADLVIAYSIGILGYSRPFQVLPLAPSTEILSLYPLALIPLFAVPLALLLHFLSIRALKS